MAPPAPIDCETAVRRLWDFLDGELGAMSNAEVEIHLATCARCVPHFTFATGMLDAVAASRRVPGDLEPLRARVVAALETSGFRGTRT